MQRAGHDAVATELDVLAAGEALWDLAPPRGQTLEAARALRFRPGGGAVNAALALARMGWKVGLAAVVGDDALGEALAARVAAEGVSTALVQRAPPRTGLCFEEQRDRTARFVAYRPPDERAPAIGTSWSARVLLLTGILPSADQAESFGAAAREARRRGALVAADLDARPRFFRGRGAAELPAWLGDADVVKASEEDLAVMDLGEARLRAAMRPSAVLVVTAGPREARALGPFGEARRAPAKTLAGSALGAGDAFTAGMLDVLLRGPAAGAALWDRALGRGHALAQRVVRGGARGEREDKRRSA
jgi:2-dehydro-3-deoxygluconokinase